MMRNSSKRNGYVLVIVGLVFLAPGALWAQNTHASINGVVKDPSGAAVPGATVTVTEQNMGAPNVITTQGDGSYLVPNLLSGVYSVTADAKGFKRLTVSGLNLDVGTTLTQDMVLQLGATTETVTVSGTASLLETTTNMVGTTIGGTEMTELPLLDRQTFSLMNLVPGMFYTRCSGCDNPAFNYINSDTGPGTRGYGIMPMMDGTDNASGYGGLSINAGGVETEPPPDVIQEFRVQTNNLSAEYGHGGTITINSVTKSGSNQFHGDAYYVFRNSYFDAAGWGNTLRPLLQFNEPGGTVGGPIRKNKTFFFAYEKLYDNIGTPVTGNVGLPAWRTGDFRTATADLVVNNVHTAVPVNIYDPATQNTTQIQCNGVMNVICTNAINPVAAKVMTYIPLPNQAPLDPLNNTGNFQVYPPDTARFPFWMGRVDQNFGDKDKVFVRYINNPGTFLRYSGTGGVPQYGALEQPQENTRAAQSVVLSYTHIFSPTFYVTAEAGVRREYLETGSPGIYNPTNFATLLGIGAVYQPHAPVFGITAPFGGATGPVPVDGLGGTVDRLQTVMDGNYPVNFTKVQGPHTLKFGFEYEHQNNNFHFYSNAGGNYTFTNQYTQGVQAGGLPIANSGINMADFEEGLFSSVLMNETPTYGLRQNYFAFYLQDDWRLNSRLTFNLGLRYETTSPVTSPNGVFQSFDPWVPNPGAGTGSIPAGAMGITTFQGVAGQGKYLWNWNRSRPFAPRLGFAYRVGGGNNTVIRGGVGLFYINNTTGASTNLGFASTFSASYTARTNPSPILGPNAINAANIVEPSKSALGPTFGDIGTQFAQSSITGYYPIRPLGYAMQGNLSVQHEWKGILLDVGYLGNLGRHLPESYNINMIPPKLLGPTAGGLPLALRRPFTEFTGSNASVTMITSMAVSDYHALMVKAQRRYANGLSWVVSYTWEKWIDDQLQGGATNVANDSPSFQNVYNVAGNRSLSTADIPWRLVFSPIAELPFGKGKHWMNRGGVANAIVGGWQVSTMETLQSGSPMGPTVSGGGNNFLNDASQTLRPNLLSGCNLAANRWQPAGNNIRGIQYLNPACFTIPANYTYGTQPRLINSFGPGIFQDNFELSKSWQIRERYRVQFKAEAIDAFNTPQFVMPAESLNGSNFGIITATDLMTRRVMHFELKIFF